MGAGWVEYDTVVRFLRFGFAVLMVAAALVSPELGRAAPAVVIVVRHAEKAAAPADDPPLTAAGKKRAEELVRVVGLWRASGAKVTGLFATEVKRTQQTLAPLATATGVTVTTVVAKDTPGLVKKILAVKGGVVVVAGHSNTVPGIIQALGGPPDLTIEDDEFDWLIAVTGAGGKASAVSLRYGGQ